MKQFFSSFLLLSSLLGAKIGVVPWANGADYIRPYLEERLIPLGHQVEGIWKGADFDSYDIIVSCNTKSFLKKYKKKTIVSTFEPPVIIEDHEDYDGYSDYLCMFTWHHAICNGKQLKKFYYPCAHIEDLDPSSMLPFDDRKLACMVNSYLRKSHPRELYTSRKKVCKFYRKYHPQQFSLYGKRGWGSGYNPVFKGMAEDKDAVLRAHKFNYCYENWLNDSYYISEKIFESFNSLCVPIYLGSSKVSELIPKETYIDAKAFKNLKALHKYLEEMDEEAYMSYIHAIIAFNTSETARLFSWENHHERVLNVILKHIE